MTTLRRDLGYALRTLHRTRRFSVPAVVTLACGIGLALALLMLVDRGLTRAAWTPPAVDAPVWERGWGPAAQSVAQLQAESLDALLWILGAATLLVLVVVCINLGILLLARGAARQAELTLRVVLGAGRLRLTRQLLTEIAALCLLGGTLGFILSGVALAALHASWPEALPGWLERGPSLAASLLAVGVPLASALLFGLVPVRIAARRDLYRTLAVGERSTPGPHEGIARRWLVILAVAASVALLSGAGLLLRGFTAIGGAPALELGYDPADTLTLRLGFARSQPVDPAAEGARRAALQRTVLERLGEVHGVRAAGFASEGAWLGMGAEDRVTANCGNCFRGGMWLPVTRGITRHHAVGPGYFAVLGIPLQRGREFTAADDLGAAPVVVVSQTFANQIFMGTDPIGKPVQVGGPEGVWYTVVGLVGDVRARGLGSGSDPVPSLYLSTLQQPPRTLTLAVRTTGDPAATAAAIEAALGAADPRLLVQETGTLEEALARFAAPLRWFAGLFTALAGFAALVAALGLFGVVAYSVARRTREVGVRMALGARAGQVVRMILGQSLRLALAGLWLGVLAALCLARLLQVLFLGVQPLDVAVYAAVALLLLLVTLAASYQPARHAARVDPLIALRAE